MKLNEKTFLIYKLFNSSFTGLSIGILFTIYNPLDPSVYSIGGIILAASMLLIAKFYEKLLNIKSFYYISLMVELMMLFTIIIFMFLQQFHQHFLTVPFKNTKMRLFLKIFEISSKIVLFQNIKIFICQISNYIFICLLLASEITKTLIFGFGGT